MPRYVLSQEATGDLHEIHDHVAADDPAAARRVLEDLRTAMHRLADQPGLGHLREERASTAEHAVLGCWVSAGWSAGLTVTATQDWPDRDRSGTMPVPALVGVPVAHGPRRAGGDVSVCGYRVDTHCLGVEDARPPRRMSGRRLPEFVDRYFDAFAGAPVSAAIELARHLAA